MKKLFTMILMLGVSGSVWAEKNVRLMCTLTRVSDGKVTHKERRLHIENALSMSEECDKLLKLKKAEEEEEMCTKIKVTGTSYIEDYIYIDSGKIWAKTEIDRVDGSYKDWFYDDDQKRLSQTGKCVPFTSAF